MYERRIPSGEQEDFLDVESGSFQVADSLEYLFAPDQSETLSIQAGDFETDYEDSNVYQTGNETLSVQADDFTPTVENMVVSQNGEETLSVQTDDFTDIDEYMFVDQTGNDTLDVLADNFTATVTP